MCNNDTDYLGPSTKIALFCAAEHIPTTKIVASQQIPTSEMPHYAASKAFPAALEEMQQGGKLLQHQVIIVNAVYKYWVRFEVACNYLMQHVAHLEDVVLMTEAQGWQPDIYFYVFFSKMVAVRYTKLWTKVDVLDVFCFD